MSNKSNGTVEQNGLTWLLNEYGRLNDQYQVLDETKLSEPAGTALSKAVGMHQSTFVNNAKSDLLDRCDIVALQISFTEPSTRDEAMALLAFANNHRLRALESGDDTYFDKQLARIATRCERNACHYLQNDKPPIESHLFHWISCHLYKREAHWPGAADLVATVVEQHSN
ncbi:MAG: hypothetical protein AAF950_07100 [Pseudomonadota bacterium]